MQKARLKSSRSLEDDGEEVCKFSNCGEEVCKNQQRWSESWQKSATVEKTFGKVSNGGEEVYKVEVISESQVGSY